MYQDQNEEESEKLIKNQPGCWQRTFYNTKFQIVLVLILCAFIGIGTPFIWQLIWNVGVNCCSIESDLRYDCFPLQETIHKNKSFCEKRAKCCWDQNSRSDQIQCYYGLITKDVSSKMPGYSIIGSIEDKSAELRVDTVPHYLQTGANHSWGPVVRQFLNLTVDRYNPNHFRVKISSSDDNEYNLEQEFPQSIKPNQSLTNNEMNAKISWKSSSNDSVFSLSVKRKDNDAIIFNTGDFSPFIYAERFIEITTLLPNDLIYGLGQSPSKSFKHNMTYPESWQIMNKYNLNLTTNQSSWFGSHPFYMGWTDDNKAYGILLMNSYPIQMITNSRPSLTFRTIGGPLDFHFFLGPKPADVIKQLQGVIGRPSLPPYWALGFHLCRTNNDLGDPDNGAETIVKNMRNMSIPFDSDCGSAAMSSVIVKTETDPVNLLKDYYNIVLKEQRVRSLVVQVPHRSPTDNNWSNGALKLTNGSNYQGRFYNWPVMDSDKKNGNTSVIYPSFDGSSTAQQNLQGEYNRFGDIDGTFLDYNTPLDLSYTRGRNMSVLCPTLMDKNGWNLYYFWKLNEYNPCLDSIDPNNPLVDPLSAHNLYGHRHMRSVKSALEPNGMSARRRLVMSLSTFIGDGYYGGHIGTNMNATWDMLLQTHIQTLEFNMYGIPLVGFPVCGFKGKASDEELCLRWYQLAALQPFMISHRAFGETLTDPISVTKSEATRQSLKSSILIRYRLLPYLYTLFYLAHRDGDPVVRPLFYEFPDDKTTYRIDKQYLLGPSLMASPVTQRKAKSVETYFPKDGTGAVWYDYYSGRRIVAKEGQQFNLSAIEYHINLHLRGGHVIPTQTPGINTEESRQNPFQLIAALNLDNYAEGHLFIDDGESIETENHLFSNFRVEANNFTIINERPTNVVDLKCNTNVDMLKIYGVIDSLKPEWFMVRMCNKDQACDTNENSQAHLNHSRTDYIHDPYSGVLTLRNLKFDLKDHDKFVISWSFPNYSKMGNIDLVRFEKQNM